MDIDKQLLEKYHLGQCTAEEQRLIKAWLSSDWLDLNLADDLPPAEKHAAQQDIWAAVSAHADRPQPAASRRSRGIRRMVAYAAGVAASIALVWWVWPTAPQQTLYDNSANMAPLWFERSSFDVLLGEASSATIDLRAEVLQVEGNLLFKPKRDIHIQQPSGRVLLRRGETYIILAGDQRENQFIFPKSEITFLPPAMQRKLKQQLNIT